MPPTMRSIGGAPVPEPPASSPARDPIHTELEHELAAWKGTEAAVCFPTGFAANLGTLCALGGPGVRVLSDELNHASIIDGCRLSRSDLAVYRHADMDHLEQLLSRARTGTAPTPSLGTERRAPCRRSS